MKLKISFLIILGLVIAGLAGYGYFKSTPAIRNQNGERPQIEITPKFFDFEKVHYGEVLKHTFKVKNTGKGLLEIKRVATSCACTTAKVEKEKLNPGEETNLLVRYDTGAMSGPHGRGKQERIIYLKSNDPVNPQVEVKIYAYVKPH